MNILLGISGSIAAYKSAELARLLKACDFGVRIVMTKSAMNFVSPMTFQGLTGEPVYFEQFPEQNWMPHIELAKWAEMILIAPASANLIARLAHGLADDLLTSLCLAAQVPIAITPAMNQGMWHHPATRQNLEQLSHRHVLIWGPEVGSQACGDVGLGRMLEPQALLEAIRQHRHSMTSSTSTAGCLKEVRVLITAGATQEPLDPVRYLTNRSSGKMGYALAASAAAQGAMVTLVSGVTHCRFPDGLKNIQKVITADEMFEAVSAEWDAIDIFIGAAAVCDFKIARYSERKIKKSEGRTETLEFVKNRDILATVSEKRPEIYCVGFAAETHDVITETRKKLERKRLDMIIANQVGLSDQGFNSDQNRVTVLTESSEEVLPLQPKVQLADRLVEIISEHYNHIDGFRQN